jgi:lipoyl synthase
VNYTRKPGWLKIHLASSKSYHEVRELLSQKNLHTVCQSARCPNVGDCWSRRTATFMILGNVCTRNCRFCAVEKGAVLPPDPAEPEQLASAVKELDLRHVVITSVTRDDLPDGGARHFIRCVDRIRKTSPHCSIELLIPDFKGDRSSFKAIFDSKPDILNHNLEVVPRLYPIARPMADFDTSLNLLKAARQERLMIKSGIMIGLGESKAELVDLFQILVEIQLDLLTIGQYLQASPQNLIVEKYYHPAEFQELKMIAENLGIPQVASGPLVRSSYHAQELLTKISAKN